MVAPVSLRRDNNAVSSEWTRDREVWHATIQAVAESDTAERLNNSSEWSWSVQASLCLKEHPQIASCNQYPASLE